MKPHTLTRADFSIDGGRIKARASRRMFELGRKYCPGCCAGEYPRKTLPLSAFGQDAHNTRELAPYCKRCHIKHNKARSK